MAVLDGPVAVITATVLHSVGVLGLMAALAAFLVWYQRWRRGAPRSVARRWTGIILWASTVANLLGGTLRTVQPGHPGISEFAVSPWVQTMVVKHVFVAVCLVGLFYLHYRLVPWLEKRRDAGRNDPQEVPLPLSASVATVLLGIVAASVLGAFAQAAPLDPGVLDGSEDGDDGVLSGPSAMQAVYHNASGTLTSVAPLSPDSATGSFQVDEGRDRLRAALTWGDEDTTLRLLMTTPSGETLEATPDGAATLVLTQDDPGGGNWGYEITSDQAVDVTWTITVRVSGDSDSDLLLSDTVTIPGARFFEINTEMPQNATFCWDWSSDAELAFDVHSHFDDDVQYYVERSSTGEKDCFTNDREGGYSLLWEPTGNAPVTLEYRVWGDFTVHSYSP